VDTAGADRRRIFNEDRRRLFGELERPIAFVCECANVSCAATVALTAAAYDEARSLAPGLLLADGHLPDDLPGPPAAGPKPDPDPPFAA
jgi:rhodanese-related sulfurtransferase